MSIETIADITTPLRTYATLFEDRALDLYHALLRCYERERGMKEHISIKLDNGNTVISIPSLKFNCLSRNRLVFSGKDLVAEVEFLLSRVTMKS